MSQAQMNLSEELEQLLLLLEKLGELAHHLIQEKVNDTAINKASEVKSQNEKAKDNQSEAKKDISFQSQNDLPQDFKKTMDDIFKEVVVIRKNLMDQSNEMSQELAGEKTESKPTQEQEVIKRDFEKLDQDITEVEKNVQTLKQTPKQAVERMTLLKAIGAGMISVENRRLALGEKIKNFFKQIPNQVELNYSRWMVNQLNKHNSRIQELDQILAKEVSQDNINSEAVLVEKIEQKKVEPVIEKENIAKTIKASILPSKSEQLLSNMEKHVFEISKTVEALKIEQEAQKQVVVDKDAIQKSELSKNEPEAKIMAEEKVVGIETEIDPQAGSMESVSARQSQGLGTVASVKEEMENETMTDYGEKMEEAYAYSIDPDPDASAFPTDEQRLESLDDGYEYDDYEAEL